VKILLSDDDINKAHWEYEKFTQNDEMKELYEAHEKFLHDKASWIGDAEEKGLKKGVQQNRQETAKRMKEKGLAMQLIEEITGLTKEEIEQL
jgi:predicted transposase/invertase (TIGR01784 family)